MLAYLYWPEYDLFQGLANIDCAFNPIRELVYNGAKYHYPMIQPRTQAPPMDVWGKDIKEWRWQKG
jgi:hypothetical protein